MTALTRGKICVLLAAAAIGLAGCSGVVLTKPGSEDLAKGANQRQAGANDAATLSLRSALAAAESDKLRDRIRQSLAGALLAWRLRAWSWLWVLLPVLALTRPGGLAFALALGLWFLIRLSTDRAAFPMAERRMVAGLGAWSALWGFGWLIACTLVTGSATAYVETELSWRSAYIGRQELVPLTTWPIGLEWWFGAWWPLWLVAIVGAAVALLAGPWRRGVALEARLWTIAYLLYLAAVWFPQSSTWRLLMPIFPAAAMLAALRPGWARALLLGACIVLQPVWIWFCWHVNGADWTVP